MPLPRIRDHLPALYHDLVPDVLTREVPPERKATCDRCSMCKETCDNLAEPVAAAQLFRADTKCCTFHPRLPNYLVGALLCDEDEALAEGQARVRGRIRSRVGTTPQWLKPPAKFDLLYQSAHSAFGRSAALRCPYYAEDSGRCTIWRYREAVCSTYFCKYVAGADGQKLWTSIKAYVSLLERQLSRYALLQVAPELVYATLDEPGRPAGQLDVADLEDQAPPAAEYAALWPGFVGREEELYRACFQAVRALGAADVERLLGLDGTLQLGALERRYEAALSPKLPLRPRLNPAATIKHLPDGTIGIGAYSSFDALALPKEALPLLMEFRGDEPAEAVRTRLRTESGMDFDDELLVLLHQHRVLIEAERS